MKILERADAYMNMGDLDQNQERITPDSGIGDIDQTENSENSSVYREIGALSVLVVRGISGNLTLQDVLESDNISDYTKESIQEMVNGGDMPNEFSDNSESSDIDMDNTQLQEIKKKIKANFQRFL